MRMNSDGSYEEFDIFRLFRKKLQVPVFPAIIVYRKVDK